MQSSETKQLVHEPIKVLASFAENKIAIHFFNWRERIYKVKSVNMFHIEKDGTKKLYHFAVTVEGNSYELVYNPITLEWIVEEVIAI